METASAQNFKPENNKKRANKSGDISGKIYQRKYKFQSNTTFTDAITATCFDCYESSSGYFQNHV